MNPKSLETIQLITNIAASSAATVAIGLFVIDFFKNRGKPLKVLKTFVYNHLDNTSRFYFVIKNRRAYTVQINKVMCYTDDLFILRKYPGSPPSYYKTFSSTKKVFEQPSDLRIAPSGQDNLIISIPEPVGDFDRLCLNMWTSYGYYELIVKNVVVHDSGQLEVTETDTWENCKSKTEARFKYYKELIKYWGRRYEKFINKHDNY